MNDEGRRCKVVPISPQLLSDLFTVRERAITIRCTEGLPPDARFVGHGYDVQRNMHYLVFESEAWELVPFGEMLPTLNVQVRRYNVRTLIEDAAELIADTYWQSEYNRYFKDVLE